VPRKSKSVKPLYRQKSPAKKTSNRAGKSPARRPAEDFVHAAPVVPAHFALREDGSIAAAPHPDPLPAGEGMAKAAPRKSDNGSIRRPAAENSPSPGGEGWGEGGLPSLMDNRWRLV